MLSEKPEQPVITGEKVASDQDGDSLLIRATYGETAVYDDTNKIKREYDEENRLIYIEKEKDGINFWVEYKYNQEDKYGSGRISYVKNKMFFSGFDFEIEEWRDIPEIHITFDNRDYREDLSLSGLPVIEFAVEIAEHKGLQDFEVALFQQDKERGTVSWKEFFKGRIIDHEVLCLGYVPPSLLKKLQKLTRVYKTAENGKY